MAKKNQRKAWPILTMRGTTSVPESPWVAELNIQLGIVGMRKATSYLLLAVWEHFGVKGKLQIVLT